MGVVILGNGLMGGELHRQSGWDYLSRDEHGIDITVPDSYTELIKPYDQVVNCIGHTNTSHPFKQPSWDVNYVGVMDLVDACNEFGKKLIHMSTDYIYANSVSEASENDVPVHYSNWYTYSKILSDGYVQARAKNYLIIRTSYKSRPYPWEGAWINLKGNFDYVDVIAELIIRLISKNAMGVYNVGTGLKNMYQLALRTCPGTTKMHDKVIPSDVTMNLDKLHLII